MIGRLMIALAVLAAVPAGVSATLADDGMLPRLSVVVIGLAVAGWALSRLAPPVALQWNEALAVTALAFVLGALVMTWPLTAAGIAPWDAWLEAVSGITTTGLTTLRDLQERPADLLFLRAWMQWYGGLGIAALTVALIMRHHASARRLLETTGESLTAAGASEHARSIVIVYTLLTLIAISAVWATGLDAFPALLHALSAVGTGGFAPSDDNIAPLPAATIKVLSLICVLAAVGLPLYARAVQQGPAALYRDPEARALIAAILITTALLTLLTVPSRDTDWSDAIGTAAVMAVSAQTDTGFSSLDVSALSPASQVVLMISMTIGGCTGSTAGGIKLIRLLILMRLIQVALRRTATAERAVLDVRVGGDRVEHDAVAAALVLLGLWALVLLASWLAFLLLGHAPLPSLFEVVSATANAGLSTGLTGPDLEPMLKLVLTLDMLFGRVEILALLVVLYPRTWLGRRRTLPARDAGPAA